MILLVPASLTLLMLIGLVGLHVLVQRLGLKGDACPHCAQEVRGLADPRCPECGARLEQGVMGRGHLRPWVRNRVAVLAIVLGGVSGGFLLDALDRRSYDLWTMTGLADQRIDLVREVVAGQPPQPQILVRTDVDFWLSEHAESTGEVEVVLREGDRDLAAWRGVGPVRIKDDASPGIGIDAVVVIANINDEVQTVLGESLYESLRSAGVDALLDDRKERAGVKFKDADLIGIPWRIVVGRDASSGQVELVRRRDRSVQVLDHADALAQLLSQLKPVSSDTQ